MIGLFTDPPPKPPKPPKKKSVLKFLAVLAAIWAAILLVAILCSCTSARASEHWHATLRITYANGQRITSAEANSPDWRAPCANPVSEKRTGKPTGDRK